MIHLKFGLGTFDGLHVRSNHRGKKRHCRLKTLHHDNTIPNTEILTIFFG